MKTEEDEAFDELARRQGMWGGGFQAKRAMAADKLQEPAGERAWFTIAELNAWADKKLADNPQWVMPTEEPERIAALAQPAQEQEEDWGALAEKQLASIKRDTQASFEDAMVRATHKVNAEFEAQPAQEPVARVRFSGEEIVWLTDEPLESNTLLYTKPPKREWVGLTNDEVNHFAAGCHLGKSVQAAIYEAEAALRSKNNGT